MNPTEPPGRRSSRSADSAKRFPSTAPTQRDRIVIDGAEEPAFVPPGGTEAWQAKLRSFQQELSEVRRVPVYRSAVTSAVSSRGTAGGSGVFRPPKLSHEQLSAQFMSAPVMLAFVAVLDSVNEATQKSFGSIRGVQNHILMLREDGSHEEAEEYEQHLDLACFVKRRTMGGKGGGGDAGSETTRETEGNQSLSSRNLSSFFSGKLPPAERSDRLDLAWMRQCYDEDDGGADSDCGAFSVATTEAVTFDGGVVSLTSATECKPRVTTPQGSRKYLRDRRRAVREVAKKCGWNAYDVYNAHVVLDFLENRLPTRPKRTVLDRLLGRKRSTSVRLGSKTQPSSRDSA